MGAHAVADEVDGGAVEEGGGVCGEALACDEDGLRAEVRAGGEEGFRDDDGGCGAVGGGTALEFCKGWEDGRGGFDLVEGVYILELRVGVVGAVLVVDPCDFGEVFGGGAVFLHVFPSCVAEHLCCAGGVGYASCCLHHFS